MPVTAHLSSITDDDLDADRKGFHLEFPAALEALYRRESVEEQRIFFITNCLIGCFLYDTFLLSDYFVSREIFYNYVIGRLAISTPLCVIPIFLVYKKARFYNVLVCVPFLGMSATLLFLLTMSHGNFRSSYLFGDILLMMCGCAIARPRLPYAIMMVLVQIILYQGTLLATDIVDPENKIVSTLFCISGGVVSIMTAYAIERIGRRAFVLSLRVRRMNERLESIAMTDALTGLGNRRRFEDETARFWKERPDGPKYASMILIDIDRFKLYNDNYGHPAGDLCLETLARRIAGTIRPEADLAVRFGGEEIIIFLPDTVFTEARNIAENIRLAILDAGIVHPIIDFDAVVTASLGVATASIHDCSVAELVIRADMALYAAKRNGRNLVWPPAGGSKIDIDDDGRMPAIPAFEAAG